VKTMNKIVFLEIHFFIRTII